MKSLISLAFLFVLVVVVYGKRCYTENDCQEGECCVAILGIQMKRRGICLNLRRDGYRCSPPESKSDYYGGKYLHFCPCQEGLDCLPYKIKEGETNKGKIMRSMRCQKKDNPIEELTTRDDEIGEDLEISTIEPEIRPETEPEIVPEPETENDLVEGPGGDHDRDDDPDCEDWEHGC